MRDHGGNLSVAIERFGGSRADWVDLSTGINPRPYPVPTLTEQAWSALPDGSALASLEETARSHFSTMAPVLAVAGAQTAIQLIPTVLPKGRARVLQPTYNEHAACLRAAGWQVEEAGTLEDLAGCDLAVVVNPNNPDGQCFDPNDVLALSRRVGTLLVDESFVDPCPALSVAGMIGRQSDNLIVLRSFGKFFGLAGLRLGFVIGSSDIIAKLRTMTGPWPVSGPALEIGKAALADREWAQETGTRLKRDAMRLDVMALNRGWKLAGGTPLFRLYETPDAEAAQTGLGREFVWSRIFPYSQTWIRLGFPDGNTSWDKVQAAFAP